ncbi:Peptidoglycan-binding (PGRP) domain of peptidoglycan hydrolases-containing protein [Microbacterium sp. cf046]|uniref:peptidoglycan-binding domain-containing protein n=1 Tax=Microbacterium sp. cf046 TaxID=1761803 RepID=UPI0008E3E4E6|nr:peptidoglycan-binding protein [Microbacterium sp. cf046]SFS14563.1 Peptidoglycan-binding (PGRP) domain of peptidoglycan hydrolases-containing protein [Microbacterium sp. cf046]
MNIMVRKPARARTTLVAAVAIIAMGLAGCAAEVSDVDRAQAQVNAKQKALTEAEADLAAASTQVCDASETYIVALDRYGDVLHDTAPTVGDVRVAGADLSAPRDDAFEGAEAAVQAQQAVTDAEQELAAAQAAMAAATTGATEAPAEPAVTSSPLAPAATVDRVHQAESEFTAALGAITDQTPLAEASEVFNSAAVALEMAWLRLFADAGCIPDDEQQQAQAAAAAYTSALQQNLADAGYYAGAVDGIYGPETVAAVEALQETNGLPVTGTVDKATADALQADLDALGGAAAEDAVAATAAVQQTLKLFGIWDGPVDGTWTPELTEALKEFQTALGVEPTGTVDAATIAALEKALADLQAGSSPTPTPEATEG